MLAARPLTVAVVPASDSGNWPFTERSACRVSLARAVPLAIAMLSGAIVWSGPGSLPWAAPLKTDKRAKRWSRLNCCYIDLGVVGEIV